MASDSMLDVEAWERYFGHVSSLLQELERQFGISNLSYTSYALERLDLCLTSSRALCDRLFTSSDTRVRQTYYEWLQELVTCLSMIRVKWVEYRDIIEAGDTSFAYRVARNHTQRQGRPRFAVSREQVEYLWSLSFSWKEIATLLGVSRATLYRLVMYIGLDT